MLVRLFFIVIAGYFLWRVRTIVATVIMALILSCAAEPLVELMCRRRIHRVRPHTQRAVATFAAYIILIAGFGWTVMQLISPFQVEFNKLMANLPEYQAQINSQLLQAKEWYATIPPELRALVDGQRERLGDFAPTAWIGDFLKKGAGWVSHLAEIFLVPVLAFYFTLDGKTLRNQMLALVPRRHQRQTLAILSEGAAIMRAYIVSQFWLAVIAGVTTGVVLRLIGMEYAVILGLFAGITRAIPVIGPFIGGLPLTLLAFVYGAQHGNPYLWIWVSLGFGTLHVFESKIIMPQFLGHALNLHAAVILIALLVGGEFFGLIGMFLAAPVAALLRLLLMHYVILPRRRGSHLCNGGNRPQRSQSGVRVLSLERAVLGSRSGVQPVASMQEFRPEGAKATEAETGGTVAPQNPTAAPTT
ncbi:MAG: AI-2E family transporter [Armatimonadaceae bacterium]